jgi:hypothetical protein
MEPIHAIADLYSKKNTTNALAFSALPDAPVQPYVAPRRRIRTVVASMRRSARRPAVAVRTTRYSTEC